MTWRQFSERFCRACLRKEGLAFFALIFASGAGLSMTVYLFWNTKFLHDSGRDDAVAFLAYGCMLLIGIMQLSLHRLLGSKLSLDVEFWKLKARILQGEDDVTSDSRPNITGD